MFKKTVPCRVCGKDFIPCNKSTTELGAFNYREVACSPECGAEYLRRVMAARQPIAEKPIAEAEVSAEEVGFEDMIVYPEHNTDDEIESTEGEFEFNIED